jgi:hypothetical protein
MWSKVERKNQFSLLTRGYARKTKRTTKTNFLFAPQKKIPYAQPRFKGQHYSRKARYVEPVAR